MPSILDTEAPPCHLIPMVDPVRMTFPETGGMLVVSPGERSSFETSPESWLRSYAAGHQRHQAAWLDLHAPGWIAVARLVDSRAQDMGMGVEDHLEYQVTLRFLEPSHRQAWRSMAVSSPDLIFLERVTERTS